MKKSLIALSLVTVISVLPVLALAQIPPPPSGGISLDTLLINIQNAVWKIFAVIAVICFLIAGILFLTARGDPEKLQTARNAVIWGIGGVVVGILSYSIIAFVNTFVR